MTMDYKDVGIVILAAGKGTRMKSDKAKVLHTIGSKSMVVHVANCAQKIVGKNIYIVVGHQVQKVKDEVSSFLKVNFAVQEQFLGTGDAVKAAIPCLESSIQDILVLSADVPLIQMETLKRLLDSHIKKKATVSVLAANVDDPEGYGRIVVDDKQNILCIREESDASENEKKIKKVNTGIYCFDKHFLISAIDEVKLDNSQAEYYLTDLIEIAQKKQKKIVLVTAEDAWQVMGVNTIEELNQAEYLFRTMADELP